MTTLRNRPTSWRNAIAYLPPITRLGTAADLSPISKAILAWMDATPRPISPGELLAGLAPEHKQGQTRGDMQRRLTTLCRRGSVVAVAGGMFKRGPDPVR